MREYVHVQCHSIPAMSKSHTEVVALSATQVLPAAGTCIAGGTHTLALHPGGT